MCYNLYTQRRQYERYENTVASRVCGCHEPGICKRQVQEKVREEDIKITIGILRRLGHKDSERGIKSLRDFMPFSFLKPAQFFRD